jgi:phosphoglycerate dehydrogenase-like enzyme
MHVVAAASRMSRRPCSRLYSNLAFPIDIARGPIVDQAALTDALVERRIAGAALDVFKTEPVSSDDPLLQLGNVIVTPHAIAWTDELFLGNGRAACQSILDVAEGRMPRYVLDRPALLAKLDRLRR